MTLTQLKYLTAIENHGGVNAAARALKVSQPTITMAITNLEKDLKAKLLIRKKQSVSLSEVGQRVAAQAKIILKEADLMTDIVRDYKKGLPASTRSPIVTKGKELEKRILKTRNEIGKAMLLLGEVKKMEQSLESAAGLLDGLPKP